MIPDIEVLHREGDCLHDFRIAVAEIVGASVEVNINETLARHVVYEVFLASINNQRDAGINPEIGLSWVPILTSLLQDFGF